MEKVTRRTTMTDKNKQAQQPAKKPLLSEEQIEELREIFDLFVGPEDNGKVCPMQMRTAADSLGLR